ncbi:TPA: carbohydrate ABC transporter permease [bacterium]|nr:carbohydrate ABC transporter permease [bacterium]
MRLAEFKHDLPFHIVIVILVFISIYPFIFMLISSFKTTEEVFHNFFGLPSSLEYRNYLDAWKEVSPFLLNTIIVSVITMFGVLVLSSIDAYIFTRFDFPGKDILFFLILSLLMIPGILTLVPRFLVVRDLKLLNTYWALILPYIAGGQVMPIFILRSFFSSIPKELFESAKIDGASETQCFLKITIPLSKSILFTVGLMNFLNIWNEYVWPLVTVTEPKLFPITVGLVVFQSRYAGSAAWGPLFAGYTIASIPIVILFLFTMKYYIAGITSGALKA